MRFANLPLHLIVSFDGTSTVPALLKYVADKTNLGITITDHILVDALGEDVDLPPKYGIEVIPGCEISTVERHLLAFYSDRSIKIGLSYLETINRVKAQGSFRIAAHPMAQGASKVPFKVLQHSKLNKLVAKEGSGFPIAQVSNSDTHILKMIGRGASEFPGRTAVGFRNAPINVETVPICGNQWGGYEGVKNNNPQYLISKPGWTVWNASPAEPLSMVRISRAVTQYENYQRCLED